MNLPKELIDYLNSQKLMSVATYGEHPWIAWVYYVLDDDGNLYFISGPDSIHASHILENGKVSCGIADSSQAAIDKKIGVQLYGEASVVSGISKLKWFFEMWAKINPGTTEKLNFKSFQQGSLDSNVYKIIPKKIRFFNQEIYDDPEKDGVFELND